MRWILALSISPVSELKHIGFKYLYIQTSSDETKVELVTQIPHLDYNHHFREVAVESPVCIVTVFSITIIKVIFLSDMSVQIPG